MSRTMNRCERSGARSSRVDNREILILALPVIVENLLQTLLGTTDTYFAGQLADEAIAGIGVTSLIMNIFISFFTAVSVGTTAVASRAFGAGDREKVNRTVIHSLLLALTLGLGVGLVCGLFAEPVLRISGAEDAVLSYAMPYYLIVTVPSAVLCLQLTLSACLRAVKDTRTPMYVTGGANLLNIGLNLLFIHLGLGIFGLGLATTLSRIAASALLFLRLQKSEVLSLHRCGADRETLGEITSVGIPAGMEKLIMRMGQLVYNSMIITLGTAAYVAHNVAGTIEGYSYIPAMGFGLAVSTAVGVALGEQKPEKARRQTFAAYRLSTAVMLIIGAVFFFFSPQLAALFTDTKGVQEQVVCVLRIIAFFQPAAALVQIMTGALQGAGDTKFPMYATFLGIWGIRIGVGYMLAVVLKLGLPGVWCAYALDITVRGVLLLIRFQKGRWQKDFLLKTLLKNGQ